ncbi:MAG: DUF2007 domain-containing protein [Candidatus Eisenbacteria sp.]|nr:DUF2007 domain-containing protein [Candidatus Eisenbacteria bacterium]
MLDPRKPEEDLVPVFRTSDETAAAVAKSILEDADISCAVKGGFMSDITGISRLGTVFTPGIQPVAVYVLESDAEEASLLLEELKKESSQ